MKASLKLEINNKIIELTLVEALELREQLNNLVGLGEPRVEEEETKVGTGYTHYPWTVTTSTAIDPNTFYVLSGSDSATTVTSEGHS